MLPTPTNDCSMTADPMGSTSIGIKASTTANTKASASADKPTDIAGMVQHLATFPGVVGCALVETATGMVWHYSGALAQIEQIGETRANPADGRAYGSLSVGCAHQGVAGRGQRVEVGGLDLRGSGPDPSVSWPEGIGDHNGFVHAAILSPARKPTRRSPPCPRIHVSHVPDLRIEQLPISHPDAARLVEEVQQEYDEALKERADANGLYSRPDGSAGLFIYVTRLLVHMATRSPALARRKVFIVGDAERKPVRTH